MSEETAAPPTWDSPLLAVCLAERYTWTSAAGDSPTHMRWLYLQHIGLAQVQAGGERRTNYVAPQPPTGGFQSAAV